MQRHQFTHFVVLVVTAFACGSLGPQRCSVGQIWTGLPNETASWNNPLFWSTGQVPEPNASVAIATGSVLIDEAEAEVQLLRAIIESEATVIVDDGSLRVQRLDAFRHGELNVLNGHVTIESFFNLHGDVLIQDGRLDTLGRIELDANASFRQEGGDVTAGDLSTVPRRNATVEFLGGNTRVDDRISVSEGTLLLDGGDVQTDRLLSSGAGNGLDFHVASGRLTVEQLALGGGVRWHQSGGEVSVGTFSETSARAAEVRTNYKLSSGLLNVRSIFESGQATIDVDGSDATIRLDDFAVVDLREATITGKARGLSFEAGEDSAVAFPPRFDPFVEFANVASRGQLFAPEQTLVVPREQVAEVKHLITGSVRVAGDLNMGLDAELEADTVIVDGGALRGQIVFKGERFENGGHISPSWTGQDARSDAPQTITIGGQYEQTESGTLELAIYGSEDGLTSDRLRVRLVAILDGTLDVVLHPSVRSKLSAGEEASVDIVMTTARGYSGRFRHVNRHLGQGLFGTLDYQTTAVRLDLFQANAGDTNGDHLFNSADLVSVFGSGEYEDALIGNSDWETGDWNDDFEFDSSDLVLAFETGVYETAPALVPEPRSSLIWLLLPTLLVLRKSRA